MEAKKRRLALAATVAGSFLLSGHPALSVTQSARGFLTDLSSDIGAGQFAAAQSRLGQLRAICPQFEGFIVGEASVIRTERLEAILAELTTGELTQADVTGSLQEVLDAGRSIRFVCGEIRVESVDLDQGFEFPLGSTG